MTDHYDVSVLGPGAGEGTLTGQPEGTGFITTDTAVWAAVLDTAAGTSQRPRQAPEGW